MYQPQMDMDMATGSQVWKRSFASGTRSRGWCHQIGSYESLKTAA
jgi:hypothetical protein